MSTPDAMSAPAGSGLRLGTWSLIVAGSVVVLLAMTAALFVVGYESDWTTVDVEVSMSTLAVCFTAVPLGFIASVVLGVLAVKRNGARGRLLGGMGIALVMLASLFHLVFIVTLLIMNN